MKSIGDILRSARERQGRTLDQVAASTRINKKFLEQIESDVRPNLPDTYYKAFLRSFAVDVGVDPATLGAGETPSGPTQVTTHAAPGASAAPPITPTHATPPVIPPPVSQPSPNSYGAEVQPGEPEKGRGMKGNQSLILFGVIILAVIAMAAVLFWMRRDRAEKPVQEVSFSDIVRERESTGVQSGTPADSMLGGHPIAGRDSLTLEAITNDTVWVRVVADTMPAHETVLARGAQVRWRARYKFMLSVGNAQAVSFRLNGKPMAPLSAVAKPVSNITYSWSTLDTAQHRMPQSSALPVQKPTQPPTRATAGTTGQSSGKAVTPRGAKKQPATQHRKHNGADTNARNPSPIEH